MSRQSMKILYVGALWQGGTCLQRMNALSELGNELISLDTHPAKFAKVRKTLTYRILQKLFGEFDLPRISSAILEKTKTECVDILWLDKCLAIKPSALKEIKYLRGYTIVGYSPDDMTGNKNNRTSNFLRCLPYYDIYFTTKTYCVEELKELGCPRVELIGNAYDEYTHRPVRITNEDRKRLGGPVGFIGQWETERAKSLAYLADNGIDVRVWGYTWERYKNLSAKLVLENKPVWGDDYARTICAFDINLCFLRKANRDLQTTRSIEIPACGAFMLAERTDEHLALFEEGKEAEFFGNNKELLEKVKYYLSHDEERKRIAAAGRKRCIKSGYSNHERLKTAMGKIINLRGS